MKILILTLSFLFLTGCNEETQNKETISQLLIDKKAEEKLLSVLSDDLNVYLKQKYGNINKAHYKQYNASRFILFDFITLKAENVLENHKVKNPHSHYSYNFDFNYDNNNGFSASTDVIYLMLLYKNNKDFFINYDFKYKDQNKFFLDENIEYLSIKTNQLISNILNQKDKFSLESIYFIEDVLELNYVDIDTENEIKSYLENFHNYRKSTDEKITLTEKQTFLNENIKKVQKDNVCLIIIPTDLYKKNKGEEYYVNLSYEITYKNTREEMVDCKNLK
jgi:hypothetical protein